MKAKSLLLITAFVIIAVGAVGLPAESLPAMRYIHVIVALCDNHNQSIHPVPDRQGNGDDPSMNLYWGAANGVKTYFSRHDNWRLVSCGKAPRVEVLERCIFKHATGRAVMVADAYRGREIRRAITDFLDDVAGRFPEQVKVKDGNQELTCKTNGAADLIAYVGHNGLMDFRMDKYPRRADSRQRDVIIISGASKPYFEGAVRATGGNPLLWTTGLITPEAYTLEAALTGWVRGEHPEEIRRLAIREYDKHQRVQGDVKQLFVTGW